MTNERVARQMRWASDAITSGRRRLEDLWSQLPEGTTRAAVDAAIVRALQASDRLEEEAHVLMKDPEAE